MNRETVFKLVSLIFVLIFTVVGCIKIWKILSKWTNRLLYRMIKSLLVAHMLSTLWHVGGLTISTGAGKWILGETFCQFYGFTGLVLTSGASWLFAIIAVERYFRFLIPCDHPATFSVKNTKLLVAGVYILVILVATGPLYGLGEYSYFRGHLSISITLSSHCQNVSRDSYQSLSQLYMSTLHGIIKSSNKEDIIGHITEFFVQQFDGSKLHSTSYSTTGMIFVLRCSGYESAFKLYNSSANGWLGEQIKQVIWFPDLAKSLGIPDMTVSTSLDTSEYNNYVHVYLTSQESGICSADFASSNTHAMTWSIYEIIVTVVIPYIIVLTLYSIIFLKNPYRISVNDKTITSGDIWLLKCYSSVSVMCCFFSVIYFGISLSNAGGFFIPSAVIFIATLFYYSSASVFITCVLFMEYKCCSGFQWVYTGIQFCKACWITSKDTLSHELSEITSSSKSIQRFSYSDKHKFSPSYV